MWRHSSDGIRAYVIVENLYEGPWNTHHWGEVSFGQIQS